MGECILMFAQRLTEAPDVFGALVVREVAPRRKGAPRRVDSAVELVTTRGRTGGKDATRRRIDDVERR
jgi:hypothetical protein